MTTAPLKTGLGLSSFACLLIACGGATTDGTSAPLDSGTAVEDASVPSVAEDAAPDAPVDSGPPALVAVALSSCVSSTYTLPATIGSQQFQLTLDTGSTTLGVASTACTTCSEARPRYKPGPSAKDEKNTAVSEYGTGSWEGEIYQDTVAVGDAPKVPVRLVAIDQQSEFFEPTLCDSSSGGYQGIIGFAPRASAVTGTNGFFDDYVADEHVANVFGIQLCDTSGTLWLGGYDPSHATGEPTYVPLSNSFAGEYYYAVGLSSIAVDGMDAPVGSSNYPDSVLDTGTSLVIVPTATFNTVTAAIAASPKFQEIFGAGTDASWFSNPGNCVQVTQTKAEIDAALPSLTLKFGSIAIDASPTESYLVPYQGQWCPALAAMDPSFDFPVASILGAPILRSNLLVFDRAGNRVGFAPHTPCM